MSITKFVVNRWNDKPAKREYSRETEHFYMHLKGRGRDKKISQWEIYFDSEAEAIEFISNRKETIERNKKIDRITLHGVSLLEALENMLAVQYDGDPRRQESCDLCIAARSAIAKARGEA